MADLEDVNIDRWGSNLFGTRVADSYRDDGRNGVRDEEITLPHGEGPSTKTRKNVKTE